MGQQFLGFATALLFGGKASVQIPVGVTLPKFLISDDLTIFGHTQDLNISTNGTDDNIKFETKPS